MTDFDITRLCAEAMFDTLEWEQRLFDYNPLHDDAQAMSLVRKFQLSVYWIPDSEGGWSAAWDFDFHVYADNSDINRAICECVAKMQKELTK